MGLLVLSAVFLLTVAIGAVLARGILTLMLGLIVGAALPSPVAASFRIAAFLGALLVFWSMAPAIVKSPAASGLLALMR